MIMSERSLKMIMVMVVHMLVKMIVDLLGCVEVKVIPVNMVVDRGTWMSHWRSTSISDNS